MGHYGLVCQKWASSGPRLSSNNTIMAPNTQTQPLATSTSANSITDTSLFCSIGCREKLTHKMLVHNREAWRCSCHPLGNSRKVQERIIVPHLEWVDSLEWFAHKTPESLPTLAVQVELLPEMHNSFHRPLPEAALKPKHITGVADLDAYGAWRPFSTSA